MCAIESNVKWYYHLARHDEYLSKLNTELTSDQAILHVSTFRKELKSGSPRAIYILNCTSFTRAKTENFSAQWQTNEQTMWHIHNGIHSGWSHNEILPYVVTSVNPEYWVQWNKATTERQILTIPLTWTIYCDRAQAKVEGQVSRLRRRQVDVYKGLTEQDVETSLLFIADTLLAFNNMLCTYIFLWESRALVSIVDFIF